MNKKLTECSGLESLTKTASYIIDDLKFNDDRNESLLKRLRAIAMMYYTTPENILNILVPKADIKQFLQLGILSMGDIKRNR